MKKIIILLAVSLLAVSCKKEVKKEKLSFTVVGLLCQKKCANPLQDKLKATKGVLSADVKFQTKEASVANVEFDANVTNKEKLYKLVATIEGPEVNGAPLKYTATDLVIKKACCSSKSCSGEPAAKPCCSENKGAKSCAPGCKDPNCKSKEVKEPVKSCAPGCKDPNCKSNKA